jgi:hypothetical protein
MERAVRYSRAAFSHEVKTGSAAWAKPVRKRDKIITAANTSVKVRVDNQLLVAIPYFG